MEAETTFAILGLVLGFGFVIFVHELGHFLVAKWVGIKVTQFALGFGPSILAWRKGLGIRLGSTEPAYNKRINDRLTEQGVDPSIIEKAQSDAAAHDELEGHIDRAATDLGLGETEYRLNWLPLGGYVKMLGQEDMDPTATSQNPRAFNKKPVWARACVISAGVVMNLIFAFVFLVVALRAGVELPPAIVGLIQPDSPAANAQPVGEGVQDLEPGLKPGDEITHIDGTEIDDFTEVFVKTALSASDTKLKIRVQRQVDGETRTAHFLAEPTVLNQGLRGLGIAPPQSTTIGPDVTLDDELTEKGIKPGMTITAVDGQPVTMFHQVERIVERAGPKALSYTFEPSEKQKNEGAKTVTVELEPSVRVPSGEAGRLSIAGIRPAVRIGEVVERSPAKKVGLKEGDVLAQLGGVNWPDFLEISELAAEADDQPLGVRVLRDGQIVSLGELVPAKGKLGIYRDYGPPIISHTAPDSMLDGLNLTRGSRIVAINGQSVTSFQDVQRLLAHLAAANPTGGSFKLTYELNLGQKQRHEATVEFGEETATALADPWTVPIPPNYFMAMRNRVAGENMGEAAALGLEKTHQFMLQTYITLVRLIQGSVPFSGMRGPVGIAQEGTRIARHGWPYLLFFLGVISVNLVVINFLPIPIVDGGLMVFLIVEKIKGSPVGPKVMGAANIIGLVLIACVFLTVTYFDVARLVTGG